MNLIASDVLKQLIPRQLAEGKEIVLHVTGSSMLPYLSGKNGNYIIVSKHSEDELKPGIIILFVENDKLIFHRIIKHIGKSLLVQGDGNCTTEVVNSNNVLGIVRFIKRGEKIVSPYNLRGLIYWKIWYLIRPLRRYILFVYKKITRYEIEKF